MAAAYPTTPADAADGRKVHRHPPIIADSVPWVGQEPRWPVAGRSARCSIPQVQRSRTDRTFSDGTAGIATERQQCFSGSNLSTHPLRAGTTPDRMASVPQRTLGRSNTGSTAPRSWSRGWGRTATGWAPGSCRWSARPGSASSSLAPGGRPLPRACPQAPRRGVAALPDLPPATPPTAVSRAPVGEEPRSAPPLAAVAPRSAGGPTERDASAHYPLNRHTTQSAPTRDGGSPAHHQHDASRAPAHRGGTGQGSAAALRAGSRGPLHPATCPPIRAGPANR